MSQQNASRRSIAMEARSCLILILLVMQIVFLGHWITLAQETVPVRKLRKSTNEHAMQYVPKNTETKRRAITSNNRELRKKPSGHLTPLKADDMDSDGVVSVAVGPPPVRPKYDKTIWKHNKNNNTPSAKLHNNNAISFVKDVLTQLGREFLTHQVNEDFVFGQYVGNSMKNLTSDIRLKMQHEILDIIVKYQKINRGDVSKEDSKSKDEDKISIPGLKEVKGDKRVTAASNNDTEEPWPDFSNLAKIVG